MPDPVETPEVTKPTTPATPTTPAVPATPSASAAVPPSSTPKAPDPSPAAVTDVDDIARDSPFQLTTPEGGVVNVTAGQLTDAYFEQHGEGAKGKEQVASKAELLDRLATGDGKAAHEMLDMYGIAETAKPDKPSDDPRDQKIAALETTVAGLEKSLAGPVAMSRQLAAAQRVTQHRNVIETHKEKVPYLAKDPVFGASLVEQAMDRYREAAVGTMGMTEEQFNAHPQFKAAYTRAIAEAENHCRAMATRFNGFSPTNGKPPETAKPGTQVVNDQVPGSAKHRPAAARFVNGVLVNEQDQPIAQAKHGELQPISADPLATDPSGTSVGPQTAPPLEGRPHTLSDLQDSMKRRINEFSTE